MRIGIDARQLSGQVVGTGRALLSVLRVWAKERFPHEVVLYASRPPRLDFSNPYRVQTGLGSARWLGGSLWLQTELPLLARRDRPDVFWATTDILPLPLAGKVPCLLTVHDLGYYQIPELLSPYVRAVYRLFFRASLERADRIIVTTSAVREDLAGRGIDAKKIRVVPHGITRLDDRGAQTALGSLDKPPQAPGLPKDYFLFVGHLRPNKNIERTLLAFKDFLARLGPGPKPSLLLAGGRTATDSGIFRLLDDPALAPHVRYLGYVEDARLEQLYRRALAFVTVSTYEGFGLPFLEAMAHGAPVVAPTLPTAEEVCGDAALYADPADARAVQDAFAKIWENPELREDLKRRGAARAALFTWESAAAKVRKLLEEIARPS
ncbi:MAG: glycosyltransferase family 4 protein [Elusimicrobia bacterium]|nr:glycosyltransferase family 4 protein [Elusimicrobiota bacterium]